MLYRESYITVHVVLNLLNELGKRDKMRGLPSILTHFRNEFNKFNNTGARFFFYDIYHMTLKLYKSRIFDVKSSIFCHLLQWTSLTQCRTGSVRYLCLYILLRLYIDG